MVFLTGQDEIEKVYDELYDHSRRDHPLEMILVQCYGTLPFEEQQKIFERAPLGSRKVNFFWIQR